MKARTIVLIPFWLLHTPSTSPVDSVEQLNHSAVSCWRLLCVQFAVSFRFQAELKSSVGDVWDCNTKTEILFFSEQSATKTDWSVAQLNFPEQLTASRGSWVNVAQISLITSGRKMLEVEAGILSTVTEGCLDWLDCLHLRGFLHFQFSMD